MTARVAPLPLQLKKPFKIAHGASTERHNALVMIGDGLGEAALPPYYPHRISDIEDYVYGLGDLADPSGCPPVRALAAALPSGPRPARAAVDMALHDLWGKRIGRPLYELLGLDMGQAPPSTVTLSIPETLDELIGQLHEYADVPQLKLKIGSGDTEFDSEIVRTAFEHYSGGICVDVNAGWAIDEAVSMITRLSRLDLMFIEQPIGTDDPENWHLLRRLLPAGVPPLIADESHQTADDVIALAGAADGINIKLSKCGGIQEALRAVSVARTLDMTVMIGCMIESDVALCAAAHLAPLADYLDLDASLHIADGPFTGLSFDRGHLRLSERPGLGAIRTSSQSS